jgi:hypothetical protein
MALGRGSAGVALPTSSAWPYTAPITLMETELPLKIRVRAWLEDEVSGESATLILLGPDPRDLQVSEIAWDNSAASTLGEYVEILNPMT